MKIKNKIIAYIGLSMILITTSPVVVKCDDISTQQSESTIATDELTTDDVAVSVKVVDVPLDKEYKSAKFTMAFDYLDEYKVSVKSPNGKEYQGVKTNDTTVECAVDTPKTGKWEIQISKTSDSDNQKAISPVKVTVEGSADTLVDVSDDIHVATDIVGLKMYFKDDTFTAEWTDTTCGNVNIQVANANNMQVIDSQTVQETSYSCPIDSSVAEIMVTVVPSVSASVDGASKTYSFKTGNKPDATVTYEDLKITNHDTVKATCVLNKDYGIVVIDNDKTVVEEKKYKKGTQEIEIPIEVGTNKISTYIIDEDGNMRSTSCSIEKDVVAPKLNLKESYEGITTEDESITIEGSVEDFNQLMINNAEVKVEGDNTFKYDYKLKEGVNNIAVIASDLAGNNSEYDISVQRNIPKESPIPWKAIIVLGIIGFILFLACKKKKTGKQPSKNDNEDDNEDDNVEDNNIQDVKQITRQAQQQIADNKPTKKYKKHDFKLSDTIHDILSFIISLGVVYIILTYIIMMSTCESGSMEPKLMTGNTVFYNRLAYTNSEPQRGDIVVFVSHEKNGMLLGKRIIGVPGDKICFRDGYVVVNGKYCDEAYIPDGVETNCTKEFTVPADSYFMLGDNRTNSYDSRYWKNPYIARSDLKGKYMGQIAFSLNIWGR